MACAPEQSEKDIPESTTSSIEQLEQLITTYDALIIAERHRKSTEKIPGRHPNTRTMASNTPDKTTPGPTTSRSPAVPISSSDPAKAKEGSLALPFAQTVNVRLGFGRLDSDNYTVAARRNINVLNRVAIATYNQIVELSVTNPQLTQEEYVRVWKTILLYRTQNIEECETGTPVTAHRLRLAPTITMPRPLADLVYSLGRWKSNTNGVVYDVRVPAYPNENPPPWWTPEPALIQKWQALHARVQKYYMCTEIYFIYFFILFYLARSPTARTIYRRSHSYKTTHTTTTHQNITRSTFIPQSTENEIKIKLRHRA